MMARHSSTDQIGKKKESLCSEMQNRERSNKVGWRTEKGPHSPKRTRGLSRRLHRLLWESVTVTAWLGVCMERWQQMRKARPSKPPGGKGKIKENWCNYGQFVACVSKGWQKSPLHKKRDTEWSSRLKKDVVSKKTGRKINWRNVSAQAGHAVIRKTCGLLTSPANELPTPPLSSLQRPSENTLPCKLINSFFLCLEVGKVSAWVQGRGGGSQTGVWLSVLLWCSWHHTLLPQCPNAFIWLLAFAVHTTSKVTGTTGDAECVRAKLG